MEQILNMIKALADGNRLRAIMALTAHDELCVCQITEILDLATATVSRHMSVLQNAGLVRSRKDKRWVYYRLSETFPQGLMKWLKESLVDSNEIAGDKEKLIASMCDGIEVMLKRQRQRFACRAAN